MTAEPSLERDAREAWQQQPPEAIRLSIEDVRRQARTFGRQVAWRNAREYVAAALAAAQLAAIFWRASDTFVRIGAASIVVGLFYVMWRLNARGRSRRPAAELGETPGLEFLKQNLARQRDLLRNVGRWYLGPLLPGVVILFIATVRANPPASSGAAWPVGAAAAVIALVFLAIWRVNVRAAKTLQARIDELDDPRMAR
jgi:hypothetical protein